ncbi:hypothetical protein O9993_21625 [Vibrio lentus]|nr:hypothetical protein [Vibrio lentus]
MKPLALIYLRTHPGDHWHVFDIVNGVIVSKRGRELKAVRLALAAKKRSRMKTALMLPELLTGDEGGEVLVIRG